MRLVCKLGGEVVADDVGLAALAADLAQARGAGEEIVLVHGGGAQATALMRRLHLEPTFVGGRRVTDEATLEAVVMAVCGAVATRLTAALARAGVDALPLSGAAARLALAQRRAPRVMAGAGDEPVDYGLVGDVTAVRADRLADLLAAGFLPTLACVAASADGQVLNVNADVMAADVAAAIGADALLSISGVSGVLRDPGDPGSRIPRLTALEARALIADGTIAGGMIAKVDEALRALAAGVPRVIICGPARAGLLRAALDGTAGTAVLA